MLLRKLAVGGMAELFLARRHGSETLVVIKRILPHLSGESDFVGMFLDEARIAAQLHHQNIVQVHELGRMERSLFIAMEYVEGIDLRKILRREAKQNQAVPYLVAARILAEVCAGLHYAHNAVGVDGKALRVVHRDVSPQNVMVAFDGRVKLVDFGIAKAGALVERSKPGIIKGKFLYLSPEQVAQEKIDHRADLFAFGTMLYEVTVGKSPFQKSTTEAVIYAIRAEEARPPSQVKEDYPPELERIVMRCLVKDRDHRYGSAEEIRKDLEAYLSGGTAPQTISAYVDQLLGAVGERTLLHLPEIPASQPPGTNPFGGERTLTDTGEILTTPGRGQPPPPPPASVETAVAVVDSTAPLPPPPSAEGRRPTSPSMEMSRLTTRKIGTREVEAALEAELPDDAEDRIDTGPYRQEFTDPSTAPQPVPARPGSASRPAPAPLAPVPQKSGLFGRIAEGVVNGLHRLLVRPSPPSPPPPRPAAKRRKAQVPPPSN